MLTVFGDNNVCNEYCPIELTVRSNLLYDTAFINMLLGSLWEIIDFNKIHITLLVVWINFLYKVAEKGILFTSK